jgi:alpha-galactosidase
LTCAQKYDDYNGDDLGSLNRELLDAESFVEWGVDYLKYDWCRAHLNDGLIAEPTFRKMAEALKTATGYSISEYGLFEPHKWAPEFCNMWRTTDDLMPNWQSLLRTIFELSQKYNFTKFVILVPSVEIREGLATSIRLMSGHFRSLYPAAPFD